MSIEKIVEQDRSEDDLQYSYKELLLINRELKHRIKNAFMIADCICRHTIKSSASLEEALNVLSGRIQAVAAAEEFLAAEERSGADMGNLVKALVGPLSPDPSRLFVEGAPLVLPPSATTAFALILHELATNALKHGAWSPRTGHVDIRWYVDPQKPSNRDLVFDWSECKGPSVRKPEREGFGSALIKYGLPMARVDHNLRSSGLECRIVLPLN